LLELFDNNSLEIIGYFTVIDENQIRQRKIKMLKNLNKKTPFQRRKHPHRKSAKSGVQWVFERLNVSDIFIIFEKKLNYDECSNTKISTH